VDERSSDQLGFIVGRGSSHDERLTDARTESKKEHIAPFTPENAVVFTYHVIDMHVKSLRSSEVPRLDTHSRDAMFIAEALSQCSVNRENVFQMRSRAAGMEPVH